MNLTATLLLSFLGAIPVEATTLEGANVTGELTRLSEQAVTIEVMGQSESLPVANLHELRLAGSSPRRHSARELRLHDGSHLGVDSVQITSRVAAVKTPSLGAFEVPRGDVASIRLDKLDSKVESSWNDLQDRSSRDDLVVVRKGDALDHIAGVVSSVDEKTVTLLLDGSPVPIPRERVFGIVFTPSSGTGKTRLGQLDTTQGDRLVIAGITLLDGTFTLQTAAGPQVRIAPDMVARIDFSLGKIDYLVDREPATVTYPTGNDLFLLDIWKYREGTDSHGDPLRVGDQTYERGLWIHSGTTLTYRLNREYRRLRGVAGIAGGIGESCQPTVGLLLHGDGKELLDLSLSREDEPVELDVDIAGVRELVLEVTSTNPEGVCEHLGLGDVRVVK